MDYLSDISLENLLLAKSNFSQNDLLVNLPESIIQLDTLENVFNFPIDHPVQKIIQKAEHIEKESGINSLAISYGAIKWAPKGKEIVSPLFIIPTDFKKNKVKAIYELSISEEDLIINPYFITTLAANFDVQLPDFDNELNTVDLFNELNEYLISKGFSVDQFVTTIYIDNFHHHRYSIIKDLEELSKIAPSSNILQILNEADKTKSEDEFKLPSNLLFSADDSQIEVFKVIQTENCVVQGPPGTGKSQVLSNIIGKILINQQQALIVSEKRVALEVLVKKLASKNLDSFLYISTSNNTSKDFIQSLKKSWQTIESIKTERYQQYTTEQELKNKLQYQLDILNKKELIGGVSFDVFQQYAQQIEFQKSNYYSQAPSIIEWRKDKIFLKEIYKNRLHLILKHLPFSIFESNHLFELDQVVKDLKTLYKDIQKIKEIDNLDELNVLIKQAAICQHISNLSSKSYFEILIPTSKEQKKFLKLKKQYFQNLQQKDVLESELKNWNQLPSSLEIKELITILENGRFWKKRKAQKHIRSITNSPYVLSTESLNQLLSFHSITNELSRIKNEFCELGVNNCDLELPQIDLIIHEIKAFEWEVYLNLTSQERDELTTIQHQLSNFKTNLNSLFKLTPPDSFNEFFGAFEELYTSLISFKKQISSIHKNCYSLISEIKSIKEFQRVVYKSNWVKFESLFPELAKFDYTNLSKQLDEILIEEEQSHQNTAAKIWGQQVDTFNYYHQLLQTPTQHLKGEEKELKKRLKKGKTILVKEFGKTRSHPSIRQLLASEALEWVQILKPIWLSNPVQVATNFPLIENLFDFGLFDEASQLELADSLGAIHRSERLLIVGDEQQMSPSTLFKASAGIDLLHQAQYYWKKVKLNHHYRSQHPALIAFSNQHFYNNELIVYPSFQQQDVPLKSIFIEKGIYEDNQNRLEAKKVAELLKGLLTATETSSKSIGIVAFSEKQLSCIFQEVKSIPNLEEQLESGQLFFKALENVQGDECDILIISLGYGFNPEGEFSHQFGPLNQENGTKRLNVLFSRAKEQCYFIHSVKSTDFKITSNESIRLLQKYIDSLEEGSLNKAISFPHQIVPEVQNNKLYFEYFISRFSSANEMVTFYRTLKERGWDVGFESLNQPKSTLN